MNNGFFMLFSCSLVTPQPLSAIISLLSLCSRTIIRQPLGLWQMAFPIRFSSIRLISSLSPVTTCSSAFSSIIISNSYCSPGSRLIISHNTSLTTAANVISSHFHFPMPKVSLLSVFRFVTNVRTRITCSSIRSALFASSGEVSVHPCRIFSASPSTNASGVRISCEIPAIHVVRICSFLRKSLRSKKIGTSTNITISTKTAKGTYCIYASSVSIESIISYFQMVSFGLPTTRILSSII